jgi:xylulose-5-phosphate/fructose-6-phosphate phosphoketolase
LNAVFEVTNRQWDARTWDNDEFLAREGRVMEMLSEHQCQGWLEGYLLTGRHGLFNSYEAFVHIIDSMFNQHAKWLKVTLGLPWRRKIASLNYLLASHVWQQMHNGFTHQDPGFIDHVVNKKASIVRVYLPPDANCLLSVWDHCLRSRHYVNVVIAGKYQAPQWLSMDAAAKHCSAGVGIWRWASNDEGNDQDAAPDVVMACCGDVPTLETLAAVSILRRYLPELKIRVVNVVDLFKLETPSEHPHGLSDADFDALFTTNKPVIFAFHGYPWLIHRLTYRRTNHANFHVRGYKEEGTITTPFDMRVLNDLDRFHLVMDTIDRLPQAASLEGSTEVPTMQTMKEVCRPVGMRAMQLSQEHGWQVKQVAKKYRNPDHAPGNLHDQMALAKFNQEPELIGFWDRETLDKQLGTRYYRRMDVEASCLACHGLKDRRPQFVKDGYPQDLAYDFNVGDLRGMYAVFIPDDIQKAIQNAVN